MLVFCAYIYEREGALVEKVKGRGAGHALDGAGRDLGGWVRRYLYAIIRTCLQSRYARYAFTLFIPGTHGGNGLGLGCGEYAGEVEGG